MDQIVGWILIGFGILFLLLAMAHGARALLRDTTAVPWEKIIELVIAMLKAPKANLFAVLGVACLLAGGLLLNGAISLTSDSASALG